MDAPIRMVEEVGGVWDMFDDEVRNEQVEEEGNYENQDNYGVDGGDGEEVGIGSRGVNFPARDIKVKMRG